MLGYILYSIALLFLLVSGIAPYDRFTWWLEVSWVIFGLILCAILYWRKVQYSSSLKWAIFLHAVILIYGAWYTYELVPLGEWMKDIFDFTRNNYDRIGHLAQGLFPAVLFREVLFRSHAVKKGFWLEVFVFSLCMAFTCIFEIIEFCASMAFGAASDAYLGSQGDVWDAQWDMIMCGIGCILSILLWRKLHLKEMENENNRREI
jgi:putative membrane protein